ncbi:MAG: hypothetical protein P0Y53_02820 [Candidatus Pseudobacter hemicellulosilyticus]|uniref:Sensor of ECF-type sigma factor n=1 Tax=Candidatus Pseudobacter hemicellulosilyticus TaxID=3121375 RepID=A0AAJ5WSW1_9BACT|nr:MAG: hypothetical protein P0Y53_02820 [Pseudobacter sp.]
MKNLLLILTMTLSLAGYAQEEDKPNAPGGRVEALKIAYITKKLNLSTEEAQKFWPVYNQYMAELKKVRQDAQATKEKEIDSEEKVLKIRKKYNGEFAKALSSEKVNSFFKAEKDFGTFLQKELLERRQQNLDRRSRLRQN